jgi:hypothetical protein
VKDYEQIYICICLKTQPPVNRMIADFNRFPGVNKVLPTVSALILKIQTYYVVFKKNTGKRNVRRTYKINKKQNSSCVYLLSGLRSYSLHMWTIFIIIPCTDQFLLTKGIRGHVLKVFVFYTYKAV